MKIPIIIDTDFGGDPDDILAALYALSSREIEIKAFITSDEYKTNHRALVLKRWLFSRGNDIPVFYGIDRTNRNLFFLDEYADKKQSIEGIFESRKILSILEQIQKENGVYISIGGLSNPNFFLHKIPLIFDKIPLVIMGGAIHYRKPGVAEHNIRLDIPAAENIFYNHPLCSWLLSDHTFVPKLRISSQHTIYKKISYFAKSKNDFFYLLVKENMDLFFKKKYPDSYLHDPLTISSLFLNAVAFEGKSIEFRKNGEFRLSKKGLVQRISSNVHYETFLNDFKKKFSLPNEHEIPA